MPNQGRQEWSASDSNAPPANEITPLTEIAESVQNAAQGKRFAPGSTARVGLIERSATRPQPIAQPQQQVLEWERSAPLDARAPTGIIYR
jgi:hypothetical protein